MNYDKCPEQITLSETYFKYEVMELLLKVDVNSKGYDIKNMMWLDEQTKLKKMYKFMSKKTHMNTIIYKKAPYNLGRYYPVSDKYNTCCFQNQYNVIRRLVMDGNYISFDLENAAPTIISQLCEKYNIECSAINDYIVNRESIFYNIQRSYNVSRANAKHLMLILTFGGSFQTWLNELKLPKHHAIDCIKRYEDQIKNILTNDALEHFPKFAKALQVACEVKNKTKEMAKFRSALGLYLQEIESRIMMCIYDYLVTNTKMKPAALIHDEILVYKDDNVDIDKVISELKACIKAHTCFEMQLKCQATSGTDEDCRWLESHQPFIDDIDERRSDQVHCDLILEQFQDQIFKTPLGLMIYDEEDGRWTLDKHRGKGLHLKIIERNYSKIFINVSSKDESKSFMSLYEPAYKLVSQKAPVLIEFDVSKSKGYLLFDNGVLDLKNFELLKKHPSYNFIHKIHRDYDVSEDYSELKSEVVKRLFDNPFTNIEKRDYVLEQLARGMAGEICDRQFMFLIGDTACGKGKLTSLLKRAFEEFQFEFDGENLKAKKYKSDMENERKWTWAVELWHRRFAISNECDIGVEATKNNFGEHKMRIEKLSATILKKFCSGGNETLPMRELYQNATNVKIQAYMLCLSNDTPEVEGVDRAYTDRANYVQCDRTSSDSIMEPNDAYFLRDDSIDNFVNQVNVADAFISILCDYYRKSIINGRTPKPEFVKSEVAERTGANRGGFEWIEANYEIYKSKDILKDFNGVMTKEGIYRFDWKKVGDWYVVIENVHDWFIKDGNLLTATEFGKLLTKHHIYPAQRKINGRTKRVRVGMRKPQRHSDNDELDD